MNPIDPLIIHRMALTLRSGLPAGQPVVLLVSSAEAGEGKSSVADLLARTLARQGPDEVLLLEAGAGPSAGPAGIERLLEGGVLTDSLMRPEAGSRLRRLGHGGSFRATQWFQPAGVQHLLAQCRQQAALTVVDGPVLAHCGALLEACDRVLLVVDAQRTPGTVVQAALAEAGLPAQRVAGVVLNRQSAAPPRWLGA